jgi:hypothetical protein
MRTQSDENRIFSPAIEAVNAILSDQRTVDPVQVEIPSRAHELPAIGKLRGVQSRN